jgi:predicted RNA-binding protein YlxR (DUF448 family)
LRFARQKDPATGAWRVVYDATQKLPGRGAYLCPNRACFQQAIKKRTLDKTLRTPVPPDLLEQLLPTLEGEAPAEPK